MPPWVAVDLTVWNSRLDRDNAAKPAMDAMQGIVFAFDSRVIDGAIAKRWDGGGERIEVTAREVNPLDYGRTG
jgi:Holliday junction resolvase RusA-like endonuclease